MKRLIFLIETKLTHNDFIKYGIDYFNSKNVNVEIYNVSPITRNSYYLNYNPKNIINFNYQFFVFNFSDLFIKLRNLKDNDFIITVLSNNNYSYPIFEELNKNNLKYCTINLGILPVQTLSKKEYLYYSVFYPYLAFRKIINKIFFKKKENTKPRFIFTNRPIVYSNQKFKHKKNKNVIVPAYDYDNFLIFKRKFKQKEIHQKKYAVYIETPQSHPDGKFAINRFPNESPCNYEDWYNPLNIFFEKFIKYLNLDLKIAKHPRSQKTDKDGLKYGGYSNLSTLELIKDSKVVLALSSSAINYAILFNKPIIFLTQNNFTFHNKRNIKIISNFFNKNPLDFSNKFDLKEIDSNMDTDINLYEQYINQYLNYNKYNISTSYEIIYEHLSKY